MFWRFGGYAQVSSIDTILEKMDKNADITYYAVNNSGLLKTNSPPDGGPNAVTWGVFPGKEIVQPTIVETISFLAWRDEFYHLGLEWSKCYDEGSESRKLIKEITENWYLVNIVHNDFRASRGIPALFDGLSVSGLDDKSPVTNGHTPHVEDNAKPEVNGVFDGNNAVNGADKVAATNGELKN